jgi:hypothetical protein
VVIVVIFGLLLLEGMLVAFVFVSPTGSQKLSDVVSSVSKAWNGTKDDPGFKTDVATTFHHGYQNWIVPLWSEPKTPAGNPEFTACVTCHKDYATERKFSVYMNHPLHAQLGVSCATCHPENAHPNPPHPLEKVCATCHEQVNEKSQCSLCHPPASLPHFYLMGAPRQGVVQCDVCHPKNSFGGQATTPQVQLGDFSGVDRGKCLSCHQEATCAGCHPSNHTADWATTHGPTVGQDNPTVCYTCHTTTWCADRCHSVTPTNPLVPRPIPTVGVRP